MSNNNSRRPSTQVLEHLRRGSTVEQEQARLVASQKEVGIIMQPKPSRDSISESNRPQPDFMTWSISSLFVCFVWGLFAFFASNKVRKCNEAHDYSEAARYSRIAYRHNISAVACCIVMICIVGVPLAISLAVQGSADKYPTLREFFG